LLSRPRAARPLSCRCWPRCTPAPRPCAPPCAGTAARRERARRPAQPRAARSTTARLPRRASRPDFRQAAAQARAWPRQSRAHTSCRDARLQLSGLTACTAQGRQARSCLARSPGGQPRCSCRARTRWLIARPSLIPEMQRAGPLHRTRPQAPARSAAAAWAPQTCAPGRRQRAPRRGRQRLRRRPAAPALGTCRGPRGAARIRSCRQGAPRPARAVRGRGWAARGRGRAPGRSRRAAWRWRRARWAPCWPPPRSSRTPRQTRRVPASACTCHAVPAAACFTARGVQRFVRAARAVQGQAAALRRGNLRFTLPPASRRPCAAMAPTKYGR